MEEYLIKIADFTKSLTMNIIYKKIEEKDKEKIERLKREVINGIERKEFYMEDPEEDKSKMFEDTIFYGSYDDNNLVGIAQLYIMQKLIKMQIDIAKELNFEYIIATIHPENLPSNRAFEKNGFNVEGQAIFRENYLRNLCVLKI